MGLRDVVERIEAAVVVSRNGAWLVSVTPPGDGEFDPQLIDAASSLKVAKRVARDLARKAGYTGQPRWVEGSPGYWTLELSETREEWDGRED